jgi:hypothetical protein
VVEIVPVEEAPPITPSTDHFTPTLVVPVTVAMNCFVVFSVTLALVGEMEIATCAWAEAVTINPTKQSAISERRSTALCVARDLAFSQKQESMNM